jgi:hypothetical protein
MQRILFVAATLLVTALLPGCESMKSMTGAPPT